MQLNLDLGPAAVSCLTAATLDNVKPVCSEGFTEMQLHDAMTMIENKDHWKNPIDVVISTRFLTIARAACIFYTGTELKDTDVEDRADLSRVTAPGYWAGPCG